MKKAAFIKAGIVVFILTIFVATACDKNITEEVSIYDPKPYILDGNYAYSKVNLPPYKPYIVFSEDDYDTLLPEWMNRRSWPTPNDTTGPFFYIWGYCPYSTMTGWKNKSTFSFRNDTLIATVHYYTYRDYHGNFDPSWGTKDWMPKEYRKGQPIKVEYHEYDVSYRGERWFYWNWEKRQYVMITHSKQSHNFSVEFGNDQWRRSEMAGPFYNGYTYWYSFLNELNEEGMSVMVIDSIAPTNDTLHKYRMSNFRSIFLVDKVSDTLINLKYIGSKELLNDATTDFEFHRQQKYFITDPMNIE